MSLRQEEEDQRTAAEAETETETETETEKALALSSVDVDVGVEDGEVRESLEFLWILFLEIWLSMSLYHNHHIQIWVVH